MSRSRGRKAIRGSGSARSWASWARSGYLDVENQNSLYGTCDSRSFRIGTSVRFLCQLQAMGALAIEQLLRNNLCLHDEERIEVKIALALVTLSPSTTLRINSAKSLVPRMTGSLFALSWTVSTGPGTGFFALSWTVSTCPGPTGTGYRVAPLLRMTERCQLIGDVSLLP